VLNRSSTQIKIQILSIPMLLLP